MYILIVSSWKFLLSAINEYELKLLLNLLQKTNRQNHLTANDNLEKIITRFNGKLCWKYPIASSGIKFGGGCCWM